MTSYNTGNPIGSKDPRDLYDNAENLDTAVNTRQAESWDDRFGVARKTWWGMEQDFQQFLISSGYENIGDYAAGLEITARNQIFWRDGELYRAGASLEFPYTTTGDWGDEEGLFVSVGDAALRQELSSESGAEIIGYGDSTVAETLDNLDLKKASFNLDNNTVSLSSIEELIQLPVDQIRTELTYFVKSFNEGSNVGGGEFVWDPESEEDPNGGTVFESETSPTGRFIRLYNGPLRAEFFGAEPWKVGDDHDSTEAFQKCARAAGEAGVWKFSGRHRILDTVWIPSRQTFGGDSQILSPWRHLMGDPEDFQGVNTGRDLVGDSVFFDADEGDCFILGEGACPNNFSVYGKGLNTLGVDLTQEVAVNTFYNTTAFRFGKFIKPKNIDVSLFRYAFWSKETNHEEGPEGVPVSGNYYSYFDNVSGYYCYAFFLQSDSISYNMTWNNVRTANTQRAFDTSTRVSNFIIISGAFEGFGSDFAFNIGNTDSDITFLGSYFEKYNGQCQILIAGDQASTITIKNCTIFLNYILRVINRTISGGGVVTSKNNIFRLSGPQATTPFVYRLNVDALGKSDGNRFVGDPDDFQVYSNVNNRFVESDF